MSTGSTGCDTIDSKISTVLQLTNTETGNVAYKKLKKVIHM